jgi:multiple sugar transport system ATP-binding protein
MVGQKIVFGIRPEDIHNPKYAPPSIIAEPVETSVDVTELVGNEIFLYLFNGDHNFVARVDPRTRVEMGDTMQVVFNMLNMHIFDPVANPDNPVAIR